MSPSIRYAVSPSASLSSAGKAIGRALMSPWLPGPGPKTFLRSGHQNECVFKSIEYVISQRSATKSETFPLHQSLDGMVMHLWAAMAETIAAICMHSADCPCIWLTYWLADWSIASRLSGPS